MSVPKGRRKPSPEIDFLAQARVLQMETVRHCVKLIPKRYTFYLGQLIAQSGQRVYEEAKKGNSIFPTNAQEAQMRRNHLLEAYAEAQSLNAQIEIAQELIGFPPEQMKNWCGAVYKTLTALKERIEGDRKRLKALP